jgi:hypothetical protein
MGFTIWGVGWGVLFVDVMGWRAMEVTPQWAESLNSAKKDELLAFTWRSPSRSEG